MWMEWFTKILFLEDAVVMFLLLDWLPYVPDLYPLVPFRRVYNAVTAGRQAQMRPMPTSALLYFPPLC